MYIFDRINFTYFAAVSKLGHFHSNHYAPVHSAVQMIPGHVGAMPESGEFCIYSCGDGVPLIARFLSVFICFSHAREWRVLYL